MKTSLNTTVTSFIVIDSRVTDWQSLIGDFDPNSTFIVLDAARDGLTQIAEAVENSSNIDAIHILSHGNAGSLEIGLTPLHSNNLGDYRAQLSTIGNALSADGDILLYGCNVAQGVIGQQFIQQLSDLTGATIAASTNLTGAESLGGDWTLEFTTGAIRATVLNVPSYAGVLTAPTIGGIPATVNFTEAGAAALIDSTITFTGGASLGGGYVSYNLASSNTGDQLTLTSDANPNNVGAISIAAGVVYVGDGVTTIPIGSVDAIENGVNGQALKINFTSNFANPSFQSGIAGTGVPVTGWTIGTQQVILGTTSIGGYVTPTDTLFPTLIQGIGVLPPGGLANNQHIPASATFSYDVAVTGSNSPNGGGTGGTQSLRLYSNMTTSVAYDIVDGPYAESNSFKAAAGDVLYFDWKAAGGSDAYDVFGYLLNIDTGVSTIVLNQTGLTAATTTPWATLNVTVPTTGNYEFVFIGGTWDQTGGKAAGGSLYVDNFKVFSNSINNTTAQTIAQQIAYQNTATDSPLSRVLTVTVADGAGVTSTASTNLDIAQLNNSPSFSAGATLAASNPAGASVSTLLGTQFTDPDNVYSPTDTLAGVAIVADASTAGEGIWEYSTDSGSSWNAVGTVSTSSALLLSASSLIRFLPALNYSGTPGGLSVHAVDSSANLTFTSGTTLAVFDTTTDTLNSPVSDLPVTLGTSPLSLTTPVTVNYTDTAFVDSFALATGTLAAAGGVGGFTYGIAGGTDNGTTVTLTNAYGTLVVTKANGDYTFTPTSANIEPLKVNPTDTDSTINVTVTNGSQTISQAFTVMITQSGSTESIGDDNLIGNSANNTFNALAGNDIIDGAAGADTMTGGTGNDTYYVDDAGDVVTEIANQGLDSVYSTISYTLGADVENLVLRNTVTTNLNGTGNTLNNDLRGNHANNILDGLAGADTMTGQKGDDTYYVDDAGDVVTEIIAQGLDTVYSTISYTLGADVENLVLRNTVTTNLNGTGNALNNDLRGNHANNILDGLAGADTMTGQKGDDTYYVDDAGDVVTEIIAQGLDTVYSTISYTLGADVENLVLRNTVTTNLNGTGNALNNDLRGNHANNILDGLAGADTMTGQKGDDTYYVDDAGDVVTEIVAQGLDTVYSTISYTLGADVEQLVLTGTAANGNGNALNNDLRGNSGNNILTGGDGADTLTGGLGNDTYNLAETIAATDTLRIATGDSLGVANHDRANNFQLGTGSGNTLGVDRLDLDTTTIATNAAAVNGIDAGNILSHSISNGIISFDDAQSYAAPMTIGTGDLTNVINYLRANITGGNTVAFIDNTNHTYVFQDGGATDTFVELVGVTASSLNTTGLGVNSVWII